MATQKQAVEVSDVVEDVQDLIEDAVALTEAKVSWLKSNPKAVVVVASLVGLVGGAALGYWIASTRLSAKYQAIADEQVEEVKAHYSAITKKPDLADLASKYPDEETQRDIDAAAIIVQREGYTAYEKVESTAEAPVVSDPASASAAVVVEESVEVREAVTRNIFESDHPDTYFDFEEEQTRRETKPNQPYVLTKDEFEQGEAEYDQKMLTYYDGDDVLCDDNDTIVEDIEMVMGYENLLRFGHGSGDPKIVYIRNNKLELDFEVSHSDGKFAKEVLGFDDGEQELRHSARQPRKFRLSDD